MLWAAVVVVLVITALVVLRALTVPAPGERGR